MKRYSKGITKTIFVSGLLVWSMVVGTVTIPESIAETKTSLTYTLDQAISDQAQRSTIAFDGLAFLTGTLGADTFFPPGKTADYFGFQYMRDIDQAHNGHKSLFLTRAAMNMLSILDDAQKTKLIALAKEQAPLFENYAYSRFPLMQAFRTNLMAGSSGLRSANVQAYSAKMYATDAEISYRRAVVSGEIIQSFRDAQKQKLAKLSFSNSNSWSDLPEDEQLKQSMGHMEYVLVMTYASELFSWYKGNVDGDVYFCPERHGAYFGSFYLKDFPMMQQVGSTVDVNITQDAGQEFLKILDSNQQKLITGIVDEQRIALAEIVKLRGSIAMELRKSMRGEEINKKSLQELVNQYGQQDGELSALYAQRFAEVNHTLTTTQRKAMMKLRNLSIVPKGAFHYSDAIAMPSIPDTGYFFGGDTMPVMSVPTNDLQSPKAEVPIKNPTSVGQVFPQDHMKNMFHQVAIFLKMSDQEIQNSQAKRSIAQLVKDRKKSLAALKTILVTYENHEIDALVKMGTLKKQESSSMKKDTSKRVDVFLNRS